MQKGIIWNDNSSNIVADVYTVKHKTTRGYIVTTAHLSAIGVEFFTHSIPDNFTVKELKQRVNAKTLSTIFLN